MTMLTHSAPPLGSSGLTVDFLRATFPRGLPPGFRIAEIGVWRGDTSMHLAGLLPEDGELHLFDYQDVVEAAQRRLMRAGFSNAAGFGCSRQERDSYNWPLMRLLAANPAPIYDYVYLDGAHTLDVDGLAFTLLDRLLKPGGYFDFDDYDWSMARSPTQNPLTNPRNLALFTEEQIRTPHIMLLVEVLVKRDPRYREITRNKIFRKMSP